MVDDLYDPLPPLPPEEPAGEPPPAEGQEAPAGESGEDNRASAPPAGVADAAASIMVSFASEHVNAESLHMAGQVFNQQFQLIAEASGPLPVPLSPRHFGARTAQDLERCEEELLYDAGELDELHAVLQERRILILAGEAETGKGSLGLLLGARLTRTLELKGMLTCQGIGASVQVDLERVAGDHELSRQVLMFEDALSGENGDLKGLLRTLDFLGLAALQERLRQGRMAILLTATAESLSDSYGRLASLGILRTVLPPPPDLLVRALRQLAVRLPARDAGSAAMAAFLDAHGAATAAELKTVARVARFVHEYLARVAAGELPLRQALVRMDDLSQWLLDGLAGDLDAQAAVLAIVVGSAAPPAAGIPWLAFEELRRRITEVLRGEARLNDDQPSSEPGLGRSHLERARAYVAAMPLPQPGMVRFRDERYAERLWLALVGPARELATLIQPLLRRLTLGRSAVLREIAATALGRLGQIGAAELAVPLLQGWARAGRADLPGFFLKGCASGGEKAYQGLCLEALHGLALAGGAAQAAAAVRSLGALGLPDPAVPLGTLCSVAGERLAIRFDMLRKVDREMRAREQHLRCQQPPLKVAAAMKSLHRDDPVVLTATLVPEDRVRLLGAVQYALAGVLLAQGGDPGAVLRDIGRRMQAEPQRLAPLLGYLFLHQQGLIDLLDGARWRSGTLDADVSRFLLSTLPDARDPSALGALLDSIHTALAAFPGFFRFLLEQRFFAVLKSWCVEGCAAPGLRPAVVRLLSSLLHDGSPELRRRLLHFLTTDPDLTSRGSRLLALARDVVEGRAGGPGAPLAPSRDRRLPAWAARPAGGEIPP